MSVSPAAMSALIAILIWRRVLASHSTILMPVLSGCYGLSRFKNRGGGVFVALLAHAPRLHGAGRRLPRFHVCTTGGSQGDFLSSNGNVVIGFSHDQRLETKGVFGET